MKTLVGMTLAAAAALGVAGCSGTSEHAADNVTVTDNASTDAALTDANVAADDAALGVDNLSGNESLPAGDLNATGEPSNATGNTAG